MIRSFALLFFLSLAICAVAQKKELYYDYNWKPCDPLIARFFTTLEKTDSGWMRNDYFLGTMKLQMRALYKDEACEIGNGDCIYFYANGNVESMGRMINNRQEGVCLSFHYNGLLSDSADFHNGRPKGDRFRWHSNGTLSDSIHHVNDSIDVRISWFDNGLPAEAGHYRYDKRQGKWQFFHRNGKIAALEMYENGKITQQQFYNEDGTPRLDTANTNKPALFKGGTKAWQNYLSRNLHWPQGYTFSTGNLAVVVVEMFLDENGKVENVEIATPFHPEFDKIALRVVKNSPVWQPAVLHGRKVKAVFRQPITFLEEEERP